MLNEVEFTGDLAGLFHPGVDRRSNQELHYCEWAFKNLTLHYIESTWPEVIDLVRFDDVKLEMMLRRFYRDAFGVREFRMKLKKLCGDDGAARLNIWKQPGLLFRSEILLTVEFGPTGRLPLGTMKDILSFL